MKTLKTLIIFSMFGLISCATEIYEPDSIIMKEEYSEFYKGNFLLQILSIVAVLIVLGSVRNKK